MAAHPVEGGGSQAGAAAEALAEVGEHPLGDALQLVPPLAQRWQVEGDHLQAVEEVGTEGAALDAPGEVRRTDGEEAHVGLALGVPQRRVAALGEQAQQLGLDGEGQLLDVVEHQRAAGGAADPARVGGGGAGEGAGAVAEELALEQARRHRPGIDLDARSGGPPRSRVERPGEGGAAAPRLAEHQHRRVGGGRTAAAAERGVPGRERGEQAVEVEDGAAGAGRVGGRRGAGGRRRGVGVAAHGRKRSVTSGASPHSRSRA